MRPDWQTFWMACLCVALAACRGDGPEPASTMSPVQTGTRTVATAAASPGDSLAQLWPLDVDNRWVYARSDSEALELVRVTTLEPIQGRLTATVDVQMAGGRKERFLLASEQDTLLRHAAPGADTVARALDGMALLKLPVSPGGAYLMKDVTIESPIDIDRDGLADRVRIVATQTVLGFESVDTQAGRFDRALRQREVTAFTYLPGRGGRPVEIRRTEDIWLAPGIGPVRRVEQITNAAGRNEPPLTRSLVGYKLAHARTDGTAPLIESVGPADSGPMAGGAAQVSVLFSEPMDPDSLHATSFSLVDSAGARIAGSPRLEGRRATFRPAQAWASGRYTARVSTQVSDLLGNALAASRTWQFTVDASGPRLVSSSPTSGSTRARPDSVIVLEFSEPVAEASLLAGRWQLLTGLMESGTVPLGLQVSGNRITLTPATPLPLGTQFALYFYGVADKLGNPMAGSIEIKFNTLQGRFDYPARIFGDQRFFAAIAAGDLDGDGHTDLVGLVAHPYPKEVLIAPGRPKGGSAGPLRVQIGDQLPCNGETLALGDIDGDGRLDMVIGSSSCGIQTLRQQADGSFRPLEFHRSNTGTLLLVDLDKDGRPELVSTNGSNVLVWRSDRSGALKLTQTLSAGSYGVTSIAAGDVDGDGWTDLVATVYGQAAQAVSILYGRADGGFDPPVGLRVDTTWPSTTVALGDLNGDGRTDLVVGTADRGPAALAAFYQSRTREFDPPVTVADNVADVYSPVALVLRDMDKDGLTDIIAGYAGGGMGWFRQLPRGTFSRDRKYLTSNLYNSGQLLVLDHDQDGLLDVVAGDGVLLQLPHELWPGNPSAMPRPASGRAAAAVQAGFDSWVRSQSW